ncbi:beta-propeller fold lactonase family protein [Nostocaceae cyanobacterium CENA357]|uniref:Beta-propeller fold lactonase family protein n=1 Tax=Atlanticothrix silvestris CENA357 TaxID=1725252 RepID=A0A8J7L4A6_9CYAN|nr:YncE family protein [Atlanticothrix silvestris]MBH8553427.1 beta-propeller fold lactonase family protein [Atlanticothrix silvestris CENA357]
MLARKKLLFICFLLLSLLTTSIVTTFLSTEEKAVSSVIPISDRDRVYTADQSSNTVSVINPATNTLLGRITLGNSRPNVLSPLYRGELNVHGMGFSPDHRTLAVISTGSNAVTLIDTATNGIKGTIYLGRSPHEGFFTPNGRELWVAVRGEDYISVIDPKALKEVRQVKVASGPGMIAFSSDGKRAYVCSSFTPELNVINVKSYQVMKKIPVVSPFCPNIAITPDDNEVWFTHKDIGKVSILDTKSLSIKNVLDTGAITNHVNFADNTNGKFAYVTVGGLNHVKVYKRDNHPELITTISTGELPHGIWSSGDGTRVYVGLENGDAVDVIDTIKQKQIARIPVGYMPQALVYISNAVSIGEGRDNLKSPTQMLTHNIAFKAHKGNDAMGNLTIRDLGEVSGLDLLVLGLKPKQEYGLYLVGAENSKEIITAIKTDAKGNGMGQATGTLWERLKPLTHFEEAKGQQLVIAPKNAQNPIDEAVLVMVKPCC